MDMMAGYLQEILDHHQTKADEAEKDGRYKDMMPHIHYVNVLTVAIKIMQE